MCLPHLCKIVQVLPSAASKVVVPLAEAEANLETIHDFLSLCPTHPGIVITVLPDVWTKSYRLPQAAHSEGHGQESLEFTDSEDCSTR